MRFTFLVSLLLAAGASLALWGCKTSRSGYESAPYSVALKDGDYELRDYPELTIVETSMADANAGENSGFRRLFGYISGKNQNQESIAMTTPVFISDDRRRMAFVLPAKSSSAQISAPLDPSLSIKKIPSGRFAVFRFTGGQSSTQEALRRAPPALGSGGVVVWGLCHLQHRYYQQGKFSSRTVWGECARRLPSGRWFSAQRLRSSVSVAPSTPLFFEKVV